MDSGSDRLGLLKVSILATECKQRNSFLHEALDNLCPSAHRCTMDGRLCVSSLAGFKVMQGVSLRTAVVKHQIKNRAVLYSRWYSRWWLCLLLRGHQVFFEEFWEIRRTMVCFCPCQRCLVWPTTVTPWFFGEQPKNWLEEGSDWYKYCLRKQVFISLKIFKNNIEEMYSHNFTNSVMWAIS